MLAKQLYSRQTTLLALMPRSIAFNALRSSSILLTQTRMFATMKYKFDDEDYDRNRYQVRNTLE
jgi:hypothetical protein